MRITRTPNVLSTGLVAVGLSLCLPGFAADKSASSTPQRDAPGKIALDLRYRYEHVDQAGFDKNAIASLLRSRVTLESPRRSGFRVMLEVDDVRAIGQENYNSTENGKTGFPVIADPQATDINSAYVRYRSGRNVGTLGRQRIRIAKQRFIGTKPWRQNEQTYDGLRMRWSPADALVLDASYVRNVNRIFGPDDGSNPADLEGDNFYLRGDYDLGNGQTLAGFAYLLRFDADPAFAASRTVNNSSDTFGLEYSASFDWLSARASWATQADSGDSELNYDADYYVLELAAELDALTLRGALEVLGGDDGGAFSTPLAAAHGYQGWADKFLATPVDGVRDAWVGVAKDFGALRLEAAYHDFEAENSSADFGTELDLLAVWQISAQLSLQAKYASFSSDSPDRFDDTDKAWLTLQFTL